MKDKLEPNIGLEFNPVFRDPKSSKSLIEKIKTRIANMSKFMKRSKRA